MGAPGSLKSSKNAFFCSPTLTVGTAAADLGNSDVIGSWNGRVHAESLNGQKRDRCNYVKDSRIKAPIRIS